MSGADHPGTFDWTADRVAELSRLWGEGLPGAEIGRRMGITKSAAVGKIHRLKLPGRPSPIKRAAGVAPKPRRTVLHDGQRLELIEKRRQQLTVADSAPPVAREPSQTQLQRYAALPVGKSQCKWPIGHPDEADFHFCKDLAIEGKSYCGPHCATAYVIAPKKPEPAYRPQTGEAAD